VLDEAVIKRSSASTTLLDRRGDVVQWLTSWALAVRTVTVVGGPGTVTVSDTMWGIILPQLIAGDGRPDAAADAKLGAERRVDPGGVVVGLQVGVGDAP